MTIRLAEVASRAQVSVSTVSRVLNNQPRISEVTRERVLRAVDVLGYERPSHLKPRRTGLVGLIIPELDNPFFPRLARHLEEHLRRLDLTPVLCSHSPGSAHEDDYVAMLIDTGVSGIIVVSGIHARVDAETARYQRILDAGMPLVLVNGELPGFANVFTDDVAAAAIATTHLVNMGHRRIGLAMGPQRYTPAARRVGGFVEVMREAVPEVDPMTLVAHETYSLQGGQDAAGRLLDQGATALVCGSDLMALGAIRAARARGLKVPAQVSVVGSDDTILNDYTDPPLTTVRQPVQALAQRACEFLDAQLAGADATNQRSMVSPELVVRESSGAARQR